MHMPLTQSDLRAIKELFNTETLVLRQDIKEVKEEVGGLREVIQAMSISIDKLDYILTARCGIWSKN